MMGMVIYVCKIRTFVIQLPLNVIRIYLQDMIEELATEIKYHNLTVKVGGHTFVVLYPTNF
jgi:hypothetical protein